MVGRRSRVRDDRRCAVDRYRYWVKQDPACDWKTVTRLRFLEDFAESVKKFNEVIDTDQ
jgi:hypothetical protein